MTGSTSAQVRKDFAYFGEFGVRGVGYDVDKLYEVISDIIGLHRNWQLAIIGAGHLGGALLAYSGFGDRGFYTSAIFDADKSKIGTEIGGLIVEDISNFKTITKREK
nr:redox-sensing transcriptional repressor Rex [endosymbiont 'TC1' of Trimyema compressum]